MPIDYRIDHARRLVVARAVGSFADADVFGYQHEVWSRPELAGYDELVDMTGATTLDLPPADRVRDLADIAAAMDPTPGGARFAIVAPQKIAFGLGRMFEAYRGLNPRSTKQVAVFQSLGEALAFLGQALPYDPWSGA